MFENVEHLKKKLIFVCFIRLLKNEVNLEKSKNQSVEKSCQQRVKLSERMKGSTQILIHFRAKDAHVHKLQETIHQKLVKII